MHLIYALSLAVPFAPAVGQTPPRALSAEDYARAERFLGEATTPLVTGTVAAPQWLGDGRLWYRTTTAEGPRFVMVHPARRTREPAFDHQRLATALTAATGATVLANRLPFQTFTFSKEYGAITVTI
jgi:hypothetical protein